MRELDENYEAENLISMTFPIPRDDILFEKLMNRRKQYLQSVSHLNVRSGGVRSRYYLAHSSII